MKSIEAKVQAEALTSLIDEADEDIRLNGAVSRDALARELDELEAEWQAGDRHVMRRTPGR